MRWRRLMVAFQLVESRRVLAPVWKEEFLSVHPGDWLPNTVGSPVVSVSQVFSSVACHVMSMRDVRLRTLRQVDTVQGIEDLEWYAMDLRHMFREVDQACWLRVQQLSLPTSARRIAMRERFDLPLSLRQVGEKEAVEDFLLGKVEAAGSFRELWKGLIEASSMLPRVDAGASKENVVPPSRSSTASVTGSTPTGSS